MPQTSDYVFNPDQANYLKIEKLNQNRAIGVYSDIGENASLAANIINDYGSSLEGTETILENVNAGHIDVKRISETRAIITYTDGNDNNKCKAIIVDIDGDIITKGSPTTLSSGSASYTSVAIYSETRALVSYRDDSSNGYLRCRLVNINNLQITELSSYLWNTPVTLVISENSDSNNVMVVVRNENNQYSVALLMRMSGNTLQFIDSNNVEVIMEYYHNMSRLSADRFIVMYRDEVGPGYGSYRFVSIINGDTLQTSEEYRFNTEQTYFLDVDVISENKIVVAYCGVNNGYSPAYKIYTLNGTNEATLESEQVYPENGIAYYIDVTVMNEDKYFTAFVEDNQTGIIKGIDFNNPPNVPTLTMIEGTLSTDQANPFVLVNDPTPEFTVSGTDPDGDSLEYKIAVYNSSDVLLQETDYSSTGSFAISGLPLDTDLKIIAYSRDNANAEMQSSVGYLRLEVQVADSEFWFEETPQILHDCDTRSRATGAGETLQVIEGWHKQGNGCLAYDIDESRDNRQYITFDVVADFTVPDNTLRFWYNFSFPIWLKAREDRGVTVRIYDYYDNWREYYISGYGEYDGGWVMMQLSDYDNPDESSGANMRWDLVRKIRIRTMVNKLNSTDNLWIDNITLGSSYKVVSNGPIDLDLIAQKDAEEGWGIFTKQCGVYQLTGTMYLGNVNSTRGVTIVDHSEIILTSKETNVKDGHHAIIIQENQNAPTNVTFGEIENNKGINGIHFLSNHNKGNFKVEGASQVNLFGCNFTNYNEISGHENKVLINNTEFHEVSLINAENSNIINSAFTHSKLFVANDKYKVRNSIFKDGDRAIEFDVAFDAEFDLIDCIFSGNNIDLSNVYTEHEMTVYSKGFSNPSTTERNINLLSAKTLTLTDIIPGTEVGIYTMDKDELIHQETLVGSFLEYTYNYTGDMEVYIIIHNTGYKWKKINHILGNEDEVIQIHQVIDRNYKE